MLGEDLLAELETVAADLNNTGRDEPIGLAASPAAEAATLPRILGVRRTEPLYGLLDETF